MLKVTELYKTYKKLKNNEYVLNNVSFSTGNTGLIFIVGESGAGKTTLLNILGSLDSGDLGHIYFNNEDISNYTNKEKESYRRKQIGFIFQENNLFAHLSIKNNILISENNLEKEPNKYDEVIDLLDLRGLQNRYPHELSTGQKQRVAIARALIKDSKIILADEPTGSLDYENATIVMSYLKDISKKCLVIVVSHNMELANSYADRILHLEDGILIKDESKLNELINDSFDETKEKLSRKEKLPFSMLIKYIISNIKTKKISAIIMTFLISILVTFLSLLTFILNYDNTSFALENLKINNNKIISINYLGSRYDEELNEYRTVMPGMKVENVDYLSMKFPKYKFVPVLKSNFSIKLVNDNDSIYHQVTGIIEIDNNTLDYLDYDLVAGKMPEQNSDYIEIAISEYIYRIIRSNKLNIDGEKISINSYDDILNKIFFEDNKNYKIVGIIDTHYNYNKKIFKDIKDVVLEYEPHNAIFTYNGYYKDIILRGETDIFKVFNENSSNFTLRTGSELNTSINIEYIYKLSNKVDVIFPDGYNIDDLDTNDVVISFQEYERLFFPYTDPLDSVDDLILKFSEENFPLVKDEFEKDFGDSQYYNYYSYILFNEGENKYQPGYDNEYFKKLVIKDLIKNSLYEVELWDVKDSIAFSKKLNIVGVIDEDTANSNLYVNSGLYNQLFAYNDGEFKYVITSMNNTASDIKLMDYIYTHEENYKFSNGIRVSVDIVGQYFDLLSSFNYYIGIILICFTMAILYYLTNTMLKNERENIGLLVALGIKKIDIIKILSFELGLILLVSFPVCLLTSSLFTYLFNYFIKTLFFVVANASIYNPVVIVVIYLITILIFISINFISIYKYSKISPISVMKKKV